MAETFIRLPDDAGNTGKRVRVIDRVVGANTVHEHFMILQDYAADLQGKIKAASTAAVAADPSLVVALSPNSPIPVGANLIGSVTLTDAVFKAASTAAVAADKSLVIAHSPNSPLPVGANLIGSVTAIAPTLTKGTQGTVGWSSQDLKDAGRVMFSVHTVIAGIAGVAAEATLSMISQRDGTEAGAAVTQAVTGGKKLRLMQAIVGFISTAAAVVSVRVSVRMNPGGAMVVGSPIMFTIPLPSGAALAQAGNIWSVELPETMEFSGTQQFGCTHVGSVATYTLWVALIGYEY